MMTTTDTTQTAQRPRQVNTNLVLAGLHQRLGNNSVLHGIDLDSRAGELLCLLGPSGCGKSTTLNIVAGFLTPDGGTVQLSGRDLTLVPPHRRNIGIVPQSYALFPHLSVAKNVAFGLEMRRMPRNERRARVTEMLQLVGLSGYESSYPAQLSGGQQQRVALARALAPNPAALLLDEPFSNLDAKLRVQLRDEVRSIQQRLGITTLFVTHDQEEALAISDRIAVMRDGRIEQVGTPQQLYADPATLFVAQFLGDTNQMRGTVTETNPDTAGGRVVVDVPGLGTTHARSLADVGVQTKVGVGPAVVVCVRPEAIQLDPADNADADTGPGLNGRVVQHSFLGPRHVYKVATDVGELTVSAPAQQVQQLGPDMEVRVCWDADATLAFPADSPELRALGEGQ